MFRVSSIKKSLVAGMIVGLASGFGSIWAQTIPLNTFNNGSTDLTSSYYVYGTVTYSSTAGVGGTGAVTQVSGGGSAIFYDTTPDTTPTNSNFSSFVLDVDFKGLMTGTLSTNFGIYFADGGSRTNSNTALFYNQMSLTGTTMNWRRDAQESTAGAGTAILADVTVAGVKATDTWYHLKFSVTDLGGGSLYTVAQYYDQTQTTLLGTGSYTYSGLVSTTGEIGIRFNPNGSTQTISIDNLQVSAIPEPASIALVVSGLGLLGLARYRRQG